MTRERSMSGRVARRALAVGVAVLMGFVGVVAVAPTAPAATAATAATAGVAGAATGQASSVTVGARHSCALTTTGGVRCWGSNDYGQLGDGTQARRTRPVDVVGLTSGVAQVSAGYIATCAVTTAGAVKCWGYGSSGQLGNGAFVNSTTPVDVVGLTSGVASISVGEDNVCAVTTGGAVKCWGAGVALGGGQPDSSAVPVDVVGLGSGVRAVATGELFACALTASGVSCWGTNGWGQLGIGHHREAHPTPVPVLRLGADVTSISAGVYTMCATTSSGQVWCWGSNQSLGLGVGSTDSMVWQPSRVPGLSGVSSVGAGWYNRCAVQPHRTLCWGQNDRGALGDGTTASRPTPAPVVDLPGPVTVVSTKLQHACAVNSAGRVFCWGDNAYGQLGDGTRTTALTPVRVVGLTG